MKKHIMLFAVVLTLPVILTGETLRLKYPATVEVLNDDGKVSGTRKLKAGTVVSVETSEATAPKNAAAKSGKKLTPSDLSPIMFKTTRPASGATLRAEVKLSDDYYGGFEKARGKFWSVDVYAYDAGWENYELFNGYVSKSTLIGKKLVEVVKDGNSHRCIVKVTFAKDETFEDLLLIQDFKPVQPEAKSGD